eukprot:648337-Amphidinium_carterae.2
MDSARDGNKWTGSCKTRLQYQLFGMSIAYTNNPVHTHNFRSSAKEECRHASEEEKAGVACTPFSPSAGSWRKPEF